jgi:hypothetical protein
MKRVPQYSHTTTPPVLRLPTLAPQAGHFISKTRMIPSPFSRLGGDPADLTHNASYHDSRRSSRADFSFPRGN